MDRRHLLRLAGGACVAAGIPLESLAAIVDPDFRRQRDATWFTDAQRQALDGMTEAILPETNTPGARAAGVVDFLEVLVPEWVRPGERRAFVRGLEYAMTLATEQGVGHTNDADAWVPVLATLEREGTAARQASPGAESFFHQLRSLTLLGYYTSEEGMTRELLYRPRPGRWVGCVPLEAVARPVEEGLPNGEARPPGPSPAGAGGRP